MTLVLRPIFARIPVFGPAFALVLAGAVSLFGSSGLAQTPVDSWESCARRTAQAERAHGLPNHLLNAISKVESGRWHAPSGAILAWPWTVTAGGKGRFLPSKKAAIAEVEHLRARGVRNIDVGCMQDSPPGVWGALSHTPISVRICRHMYGKLRNSLTNFNTTC